LVSDLALRVFRRAGYDVTYVRNYTDVDDKIIAQAAKEGGTSESVAEKYIVEVEKDYAAAFMLEPTHKTRVTDHIPEIVAMIERILANAGYLLPSGEVLFSIDRFERYGKLSRKPLEDLIAGHRVELNREKRNPLDFTLWKPAKPGEPKWDSPWGPGRPGWHIECSAMAGKWLGDEIDLHHGGEDLIFPHHENEIAQSESASGHHPYVRHWLHHAFVTMSKAKMSKSLGNVFTAREFLTRFGGEVARMLFLGVHYRQPIDFSEAAIHHAIEQLVRIYEAKAIAVGLMKLRAAVPDPRAEEAWGQFVADAEAASREIDAAYFSDLNTAGALGALFTAIRSFNRTSAVTRAQVSPSAVLGAQALVRLIEESIGGVLGVGRGLPETRLHELGALLRDLRGGAGPMSPEAIEKAISARAEAKARRDFAEADRIRTELAEAGVVLKDGPGGTKWTFG